MAASYEADPEVRLMSRVAKGDAEAFDALVRRVVDPLTAFLSKRVGDRDLAADLAQETLLRVFKSRNDYRPDARFRTWLFRIAMNVDLNRRRYEGYRVAASFDAAADAEGAPLVARTPDARVDDPSVGPERDELKERVRSAVAGLPESQRTAVALLRFHELSYEEIGRAMDLTVPAVKSLLNRAKENLRKSLAPDLESALRPAAANAAKGTS